MKFIIKKKQPKTYYAVVLDSWKVNQVQHYECETLDDAKKKFCNSKINEDYMCLNLIEFQKDGDGDPIEMESIFSHSKNNYGK